MKKKSLAGFTIGLFLLCAAGITQATTFNIPMDLGSWTRAFDWGDNPAGGSWEQSSDGIKFTGTGYRQGAFIYANITANLSGATVYEKYMVHGGSIGYMGAGPTVGNPPTTTFRNDFSPNYTTRWSFNGSSVLPEDTWLFTRIVINSNMTWEYITSVGNYDILGGTLLFDTMGTWTQTAQLWNDAILNGSFGFGIGDNYGGTSAWAMVGEAKYEITTAQVPEPPTMLLFSIGMTGLVATRFRRQRGRAQ